MTLHPAAVVHTSIEVPPATVFDFLADLHNWNTWAPWIQSVTRLSPRDWTLETEAGTMKFHFVEPNTMGVLDHQVTLSTGATVTNSLRVVANGAGAELVMVLFQWPHMSPQEFERDTQAVTSDLARIKEVLEGGEQSARA